MDRRLGIIIGGLLALGALELGLFGASAAGLTGGSSDVLPPIVERGVVEATETGTPIPITTVTPTIEGRNISLTADPPVVACQRAESSVVTATITESGVAVPDGTRVTFLPVALGTADPINTSTVDGVASSVITPLSGTQAGITVIVTAFDDDNGDVQTSIRIECAPLSPPDLTVPASIELTPNPIAIHCNGIERTALTVRVTDPFGNPVPDGTPVFFFAFSGDADPQFTQTAAGTARTSAVFYSDATPTIGPNLLVNVGQLEAGIRIRCFPDSGSGCPPSPPTTPPCVTPTSTPCSSSPPVQPPSPPVPACPPPPPPCNPSPGSGPVSPPCPTAVPCNPSVPTTPPCATPTPTPFACNPSVPTTPPCVTPTPTGPLPPVRMAIDCDLRTAGIQSVCEAYLGSTFIDVGVVALNESSTIDTVIASFDFELHDPDTSRLNPPNVFGGLDGNPDFNESVFGRLWGCRTTPGVGQARDEDGAGTATIFLSCNGFSVPAALPSGGQVLLATARYNVPEGAESGDVTLRVGGAAIAAGVPGLGSCEPVIDRPMRCDSATIELRPLPPGVTLTATPTPTRTPPPSEPTSTPVVDSTTPTSTPTTHVFLAIDCDPYHTGLQDECRYRTYTQPFEIAIVLVNNIEVTLTLGALNFEVIDSDTSRLYPPERVGDAQDSNPDFNQMDLEGNWNCTPPPPDNNRLPGGSTTAISFLSCFVFPGIDPGVASGEVLTLATVHYTVPTGAAPGDVRLTLGNVAVADGTLAEIASCNPPIDAPVACLAATITLVDTPDTGGPPTPTVTPPPPATPTAVPTATNTPAPPTPTRTARPTATRTPRATNTPTLAACPDADRDGRVDIDDLRLISEHIGRKRYDARFDVNGDGKITGRDVMLAARQLGRRC